MHFDTNHRTHVMWDLEDADATTSRLKATIGATLPAEATLTDEQFWVWLIGTLYFGSLNVQAII